MECTNYNIIWQLHPLTRHFFALDTTNKKIFVDFIKSSIDQGAWINSILFLFSHHLSLWEWKKNKVEADTISEFKCLKNYSNCTHILCFRKTKLSFDLIGTIDIGNRLACNLRFPHQNSIFWEIKFHKHNNNIWN